MSAMAVSVQPQLGASLNSVHFTGFAMERQSGCNAGAPCAFRPVAEMKAAAMTTTIDRHLPMMPRE